MNPGRTDNNGVSPLALLLILTGALLVAASVRIYQVDSRTLTHPEFWVPRLEVPAYVTHPPSRMNTTDLLQQTFYPDVHPPGYHLTMLGWNSAFGTKLLAMRLSSVLFGTLAVLAIFLYTRAAEGPKVALLAAWMLALHGHHVFWSQQLRPWALLTLVGALSSYLLIRLQRNYRPGLAVAYAAVTSIGLWIDYFFWPLFAGQVLWVVMSGERRAQVLGPLGAQALALVLAVPVFLYLRYHILRPSHLSELVWPYVPWMLGFGGVLHPNVQLLQESAWRFGLYWIVAIAGAVAFVAGLGGRVTSSDASTETHTPDPDADSDRLHAAWYVGAAAVVSLFVWFVLGDMVPGKKSVYAAAALPWIFVAAWLLLARTYHRWSALPRFARSMPVVGTVTRDLSLVLGGLLCILLAVVSLVKPLFTTYTLLTYAPFFLVVMARGVLRFPRVARVAVPALVIVFVVSVVQWATAPRSARDYQGLARQITDRARVGDVILVENLWYTSPIHYYLDPNQFTVVPPPGDESAPDFPHQPLPDRVWIVQFGPPDELDERLTSLSQRLSGYSENGRVTAYHGAAALLEKESEVGRRQ